MNQIKELCSGCAACANVCGHQAITMQMDDDGFLHPIISQDKCIDCMLCVKTCPVVNHSEERDPLFCYAAKKTYSEIQLASSSGGVFSALAKKVLSTCNGVVFGATMVANKVFHTFVTKEEDLHQLMGSKYLQSEIGDSFRRCKDFLKEGCQVLFSGTPCQISGLRRYLRKDYENLLAVDVICHGVPSSMVFDKYVEDAGIERVISFRDKTDGWRKFAVVVNKSGEVIRQPHNENPFFKVFITDLCLRESCHNCQARKGRSNSDITLGDFWGVYRYHPDFYDENGVSAIIAWTVKGVDFVHECNELSLIPTALENITRKNPALEKSMPGNPYRKTFMNLVKTKGFSYAFEKVVKEGNHT